MSGYPYAPLQFDQGDSRRYTADGDWAANQYKAECSADAAMAGLSALPSSFRGHSVLCAKSPRVSTSSGRTLNVAGGDSRADTSTGDWDPGFWKGECASNEVMSGIAQTPSGVVQGMRCSHGVSALSCQTVTFVNGDNRLLQRNNDWGVNAFKTECGSGQRVKGVSVNPLNGFVHAILCCNGQY